MEVILPWQYFQSIFEDGVEQLLDLWFVKGFPKVRHLTESKILGMMFFLFQGIHSNLFEPACKVKKK